MFTKTDIMCNLHLIVEFATLLDDGCAKTCAVNGRACANFNIVFKSYIPNLRNFPVNAFTLKITVTVCTNHCTGLQNNTVTNFAFVLHHRIWIKDTIRANQNVGHDHYSCMQDCIFADPHTIVNHNFWSNNHIPAELCAFADNGAGMNCGLFGEFRNF